MQRVTTLRNHTRLLAAAAMFAVAISGLPAVHAYAQPRGGAGGADTRPDNATCEKVTAGFYDCTTPDGGEWYCTNDTDPTACVQVKTPTTQGFQGPGSIIIVHPVNGGVFAPVTSGPTNTTPRLPVGASQAMP